MTKPPVCKEKMVLDGKKMSNGMNGPRGSKKMVSGVEKTPVF